MNQVTRKGEAEGIRPPASVALHQLCEEINA